MCKFLTGPQEVIAATNTLLQVGLIPSACCQPKDWDTLNVVPQLTDGDILDMGCQGSVILINCVKRGLVGRKIGIDFTLTPAPYGATHVVGDLLHTSFSDSDFDFITCISVIEHGVNGYDFFKECSRLLRKNGKLFVTFDYWDPKLHTTATVFGLPWCIFCRQEVEVIIGIAKQFGLELLHPVDWTIGEPVIKPGYFSPCEHSYTFGLLEFRKT
jgi:SAM-dependent methyltransferase